MSVPFLMRLSDFGAVDIQRRRLLVPTGILLLAFTMRVVFLTLTANTYDYDEFVLLLLGRDFALGSVPYRDFMFFHPPGVLVILSGLQPLTSHWWPSARIFTALIDSVTAVMLWRIGVSALGRREGVAAGLLYALSPLALISASRVGQDPLITAFGVGGLLVLVAGDKKFAPLIAGVCLGLAIWIKYPALYFMPAYLLLAGKRSPVVLVAAMSAFVLLMAPFHAEWSQFWTQTVTFQRSRWSMDIVTRIETTALFWCALSPLAVVAACYRRRPYWMWLSFLLGSMFVLIPQVYYHYFVPVAPFAALLGSIPAVYLYGRVRLLLPAIATCAALLIGFYVGHSNTNPMFVRAAKLSQVAPTVRFIQDKTRTYDPVLGDRFEYAFLANRPSIVHYFWNVGVLVDAKYLEKNLPRSGAVVLSYGPSSGYPSGFVEYLDKRYTRTEKPATTIWTLKR